MSDQAPALSPVGASRTTSPSSEAVPQTLPAWLSMVFFASGFAALLYQVIWQRALYAIFGVNIESVTIVVTAFLLGLGLGSLVGGVLSIQAGPRTLLLFGLLEIGIGAFGVVSLGIFRQAGVLTLDASSLARAAVTFLVLLVPTMMMGATLPLLVAYAVKASGNVGRSVGMLYFVNTAGSALAALAGVLVIIRSLGESGSVHLAGGVNFMVGTLVLCGYSWSRAPQRRE